MRIAVIGAGAIGSVFGARPQSAGAAVTLFDINEAHVEAIRACGLTLGDASGERSVAIPATSRSVEIARHARERIAPHLDEAALEAAARRERAARP